MLEVHIQNFSYGKKEILNQIDLELPSSQIIGLVAPNGVGKSTLIQILSGHLRNNGISVCYHGKNYTTDTLFMRQHIVKMPDQSELYDELNGIEHLNFYASMWKVAAGTVQAVVEQLKMEDYILQKVGGYSLGMRQRLCFALVLVTKADVDTLQLTFISKAYFEKFVEQFPRELERLNSEERQLSIHLTEGELPKEKWKWILENIHQCSEIKIGAKGCYALYKELYG